MTVEEKLEILNGDIKKLYAFVDMLAECQVKSANQMLRLAEQHEELVKKVMNDN
jgi:hypothetical protein